MNFCFISFELWYLWLESRLSRLFKYNLMSASNRTSELYILNYQISKALNQ